MITKNPADGSLGETPAKEVKMPTIEEVEKWITLDCGSAIQFLSAIHHDAGLKRMVAEWCLGKMQNQRNAELLKTQGNLFDHPKGVA